MIRVGPAARGAAGAARSVGPRQTGLGEEAAERVGQRDLRLVVVRAAGVHLRLAVTEQIVGGGDAGRPVAERLDLAAVAGVGLGRVFALRRQQVGPDDVRRHAAAEVLRLLPVVAEAAVQAPFAVAVAVLQVAVVRPPVAVAELVAVHLDGIGHDPLGGAHRHARSVAAVARAVADALFTSARAAAVVREAEDRVLAVAEAELQAVVAAEEARQEVRAVGLQFGRVPHRLVRAARRPAADARRAVVERLDVPEAVAARRARARLIRRGIGRAVDIAALEAVTLRRHVLVVQEEAAVHVGELVVEHQLVGRDPGVRDGVRRQRQAPRLVARLLEGRFLLRRRRRAARVAVLVVALEQVLELVRRVQLVVELPLQVLDHGLVVRPGTSGRP